MPIAGRSEVAITAAVSNSIYRVSEMGDKHWIIWNGTRQSLPTTAVKRRSMIGVDDTVRAFGQIARVLIRLCRAVKATRRVITCLRAIRNIDFATAAAVLAHVRRFIRIVDHFRAAGAL